MNNIKSHKRYESRDDTETNGLMKRFKPWTIKWFSEYISILIVSHDKFQPYNFLLHQVSNEMISNFDMFGLLSVEQGSWID